MIRALIRKELREHWVVLCITIAIDAFMLTGFLVRAGERGGRFSGLLEWAGMLGALTALVAANRLFVREYAGRTQLFLEVLPIGRPRIWATKWLFGWSYMAAITVAAWLASWLRALRTEPIASYDALRVLLWVGSFMFVVWSFATMAGMLGRHRYTAWIGVVCIASFVTYRGKLNAAELPVLDLLGPHVAMAHAPIDWSKLLKTWALAGGFCAASATLALAGSGAIASMLAQKMTARERVFIVVFGVVGMFAYSTVERRRSKPPYAISAAVSVATAHARVGILQGGGITDAAARQMARTIADDLEQLVGALGLDSTPAVFVLPKRGFDPTVIERAELDEAEGIVLRAAPDVVLSVLRTEVLRAALADHTRQRALREDRQVLADGFTAWWALRAEPSEREERWLRAAASSVPVSVSTLTRWLETQERVGACVADALAFATMDVLRRRLGADASSRLARALFPRPSDDVRVLFEPKPAALLAGAGVTWSALAAEAEQERQLARARYAAELARVPQRTAAIDVKHTPRQGTRVEVGMLGAPAYWALYTVLGPWAGVQTALSRLDIRAARATLPLSTSRGARVLVALETEDAVLHCPLRVRAERISLP